jgi:hypothetical protein
MKSMEQLPFSPKETWDLIDLVSRLLDEYAEKDALPHSSTDYILEVRKRKLIIESSKFSGKDSQLILMQPTGEFATSAYWQHELIYQSREQPHRSIGAVVLYKEGSPSASLPDEVQPEEVYTILKADLDHAH